MLWLGVLWLTSPLPDVLCMPPTALGPWQRAGAYATLDKRALLALPVAQLARASGCLVLVWVTCLTPLTLTRVTCPV